MMGRISAVLVSLAVLSGCSGGGNSGVVVQWAESDSDPGNFGMSQSDLEPGHLVSFGAMTLCVSGGATAKITGAHFDQAEHLRIERYAVRTISTPGLGGSSQSIMAEGFAPSDRTVTSQCDKDDDVSEFAADFVADAPGVARGRNLVVEYASGGTTKSVTIPVSIVLCSIPQDECPSPI
jgi:hypothetical protein